MFTVTFLVGNTPGKFTLFAVALVIERQADSRLCFSARAKGEYVVDSLIIATLV